MKLLNWWLVFLKRKNRENILSKSITQTSLLVPNLLLIIYVCIDLLKFFQLIPFVVGNLLTVILGILIIIYSCLKNDVKKQIPILVFILIYTIFGAISMLYNKNADFQELIWPLAFIGISTLFLNFQLNLKITRNIYYLVAIVLMFQIIVSGSIDNLEISSSRNTIGIMMLIYFSVYALTCFENNQKITIFPVLIGLVVVVMAIGRSSIITFLLLTVFFIIFDFKGNKHKFNRPIKSMFVFILAAILIWLSYDFFGIYFKEVFTNFESRGLDSLRNSIWTDYIIKTFTSSDYFLFGTPISGTYLLNLFNQNLHNSFLMLHAKYGIVMVVLVIMLIVKSFIYYIRTNNILYFVLLFLIIFRMQFDYTNFNAQLDIILYYFIFFPFGRSKKREVGNLI